MIAAHIEDIALASYEAGQIRAANWVGLIPVPIPEIYIRQVIKEAMAFSGNYDRMHRSLAVDSFCQGFIDTFSVDA